MSDRKTAAGVVALMLCVAAWTYFYYRACYNFTHRLRPVEAGRFYRSGQLTADGFRKAVRDLKIRTVLNVQDDNLDPAITRSFLDRGTIKESALCKEMGVNFVVIAPDLVPLNDRKSVPEAVAAFRRVIDDEANYPILLHCKAGLHRTGLLSAIYRMDKHGWSRELAHYELKEHGFGDRAATRLNPYIEQYLLRHVPRRPATNTAANVADDNR